MAGMPVLMLDERYHMEYAIAVPRDILSYCKIVMEDHRTEKYERINYLLDAYNHWDQIVHTWTGIPQTEEQRGDKIHKIYIDARQFPLEG